MQILTQEQTRRLVFGGIVDQTEEHRTCKQHAKYDLRGVCYRETTLTNCALCEYCHDARFPFEFILDRRSARYLMPHIIKRNDNLEQDDELDDAIEFKSANLLGWRIRLPLCIKRVREVVGMLEMKRAEFRQLRLPIAAAVRALAVCKRLPAPVTFLLWRLLYGPRPICIFC